MQYSSIRASVYDSFQPKNLAVTKILLVVNFSTPTGLISRLYGYFSYSYCLSFFSCQFLSL